MADPAYPEHTKHQSPARRSLRRDLDAVARESPRVRPKARRSYSRASRLPTPFGTIIGGRIDVRTDAGRSCHPRNASRASWPWSTADPKTPLRDWRTLDAGALSQTRVFPGLTVSPSPQFHVPLVRTRGRRPCLPDPMGPVPTSRNETSGDRFVRRAPLAIRCATVTYVERAMGLEPTTSSLGSMRCRSLAA